MPSCVLFNTIYAIIVPGGSLLLGNAGVLRVPFLEAFKPKQHSILQSILEKREAFLETPKKFTDGMTTLVHLLRV